LISLEFFLNFFENDFEVIDSQNLTKLSIY